MPYRTMLSSSQMSEQAENNLRKFAQVSLFLAAGACLVFWLLRIWNAFSFVTPLMIVTTGGEEESLFAVWKITQHQAVYANSHQIPFAYSGYNWAFYYFYGWITQAMLHLFRLDAIWIPTIGRVISLAFTAATGGIFFLALRDFVRAGLFASRKIAWAWTLIVALYPLVGYFSLSVRPDIGALAFEVAGFYFVLRYLRDSRFQWIVAAALLFYIAWAFKQSSVTLLTGSALTLMLFRRWKAFLTLSGTWWLLTILTLIVGGPAYRESILFSQKHVLMLARIGLNNVFMAGLRDTFFLPGVAGILFLAWKKRHLLKDKPIEVVLALVISFSFCFALATSCKAGALSYYFMPTAWVTMFGAALLWEQLNWRVTLPCLAICSWLMICGIARGHTFWTYDYRYVDAAHRAVAEKLRHLPGPVFVTEVYANMPWVQRVPPYFIVAFTYDYDRDAGVPFEGEGVEGLAAAGYFATFVTDQSEDQQKAEDLQPALLKNYKLVDEYKDPYSDYKFYRRIEPGNH